MRTIKVILLLTAISFLSCKKESEEQCKSEFEVHEFLQLVLNGQYHSWDLLPIFCPDDIPILLKYANDFQEIQSFPHNPVSSYLPPRLTLGECILWTIEAIKKNYNTDHWYYPSYHPVLCKDGSESNPGEGLLNEQELNEVYELYFDWWSDYQINKLDTYYKKDVLSDSGFHWI